MKRLSPLSRIRDVSEVFVFYAGRIIASYKTRASGYGPLFRQERRWGILPDGVSYPTLPYWNNVYFSF